MQKVNNVFHPGSSLVGHFEDSYPGPDALTIMSCRRNVKLCRLSQVHLCNDLATGNRS